MAEKCPKCGYDGTTSTVDELKNGAAGAAAGAAIGSMVPIIGTAIGAGIGGVLGLFSTTEYECKKCNHKWKG